MPHQVPCFDCSKPAWVDPRRKDPTAPVRCQPCRIESRRVERTYVCAMCAGPTSGTAMCHKCANKARRKVGSRVGRTCEVCGQTFNANYDQQRTCSRTCGLAIRKPIKPRAVRAPRCAVSFPTCICGNLFAARMANARYCSPQCRIDSAGLRVRDLYSLATGLGVNGAGWYSLLVDWLRERDGDHCAICLMDIDFTIKSGTRGSDWGRSIDHIVPKSMGGADDPENLRLAHWGCNRRRSNRVEQDEIALFQCA